MKDRRYINSLPKNVDYSLTERERLIRAAAFVDGEGCIMVLRVQDKYDVNVVIPSTTPVLIEWMRDNFGGSISNRKTTGKKPMQAWKIGASTAEYFLRGVSPYLLVKQLQALNAIEFRDACITNWALPPTERFDLEVYYRKSAELNDSSNLRQRY